MELKKHAHYWSWSRNSTLQGSWNKKRCAQSELRTNGERTTRGFTVFHSFQNIAQHFGQKKSALFEEGGGVVCMSLTRKNPKVNYIWSYATCRKWCVITWCVTWCVIRNYVLQSYYLILAPLSLKKAIKSEGSLIQLYI